MFFNPAHPKLRRDDQMNNATRGEKLAISFPAILSLCGLVGWSVKVLAEAQKQQQPSQSNQYGR